MLPQTGRPFRLAAAGVFAPLRLGDAGTTEKQDLTRITRRQEIVRDGRDGHDKLYCCFPTHLTKGES
jgi:hypothetical protein